VSLTQYCSGDYTEKTDIGGACRAYGGQKRRKQGLVGGALGKEDTWKTQAQTGR